MAKETEYTILQGSTPTDLAREVNKNLKKGWQLAGGVSVSKAMTPIHGVETVFAQAMTK